MMKHWRIDAGPVTRAGRVDLSVGGGQRQSFSTQEPAEREEKLR
jgi:hypothetical protein